MRTSTRRRQPLNRDRVLQAAVELADRDGIDALTMRNLAQELGVEAMSLYHHVANKDAILDGIVEVVVTEIDDAVTASQAPSAADDWTAAARHMILTARSVLLQHPWAPDVIEARASLSPAVLRYFERLLGAMRAGGCSWDLAHHSLHALGSRALGFSQELFRPDGTDEAPDDDADALAAMADELPNLVGMLAAISHDDPQSTIGWCDDQEEFEFAVDLLLDGIERRRRS